MTDPCGAVLISFAGGLPADWITKTMVATPQITAALAEARLSPQVRPEELPLEQRPIGM